jgi:hypothetical protein
MEIGLGQMGMSPEEFDSITVAEFIAKQKGFFDLELRREKQHWYRTVALLNIQLQKKDRINPERLFEEKKKKPKRVMTREEFEKLNKRWSKFHVAGEPKFPIPG